MDLIRDNISFSQASLRNIAPNENEYPSGNLNAYCKQGYPSALQIINHSANTSYNNTSASATNGSHDNVFLFCKSIIFTQLPLKKCTHLHCMWTIEGGPPGLQVHLLSLLSHPQSWWPDGSSPSGVTLRPEKAQGRNRREEASLPKGLWGRREFPRGPQQSWSADSPEPVSCR